jgi:serine/threonine protein phosphatase PrpC/Leucine-rich repeat (LRR) protein
LRAQHNILSRLLFEDREIEGADHNFITMARAVLLEPLDRSYFDPRDPPMTAIEARNKRIPPLPARGDLISQVQTVRLFACGLTSTPVGLSAFVNVITLSLAENDIESLPERALADLPKLETLELQHNRIAELNCVLPASLQTLNVSFNAGFRVASIWSAALPSLRTLKVTHCGLDSLPREVPPWGESVRALHLDGNGFDAVPPVLAGFPMLDELTMFANRLRGVDGLSLPQHFKQINFAFNNLQRFAPGPDLWCQTVDLSSNMFRDVPSEVIALSSIRVLSLSRCELSGVLDFEVPPNIIILDVSRNAIAGLSDRLVASLGSLLTLSIVGNRIAQFPDCFPDGFMMTNFLADENRFKELPQSLLVARRLEVFSCASCKLRRLGNFEFPQLRQFSVQFNALHELPDTFESCVLLASLNVSFNSLTDLPRSLRSCRKVTTLLAVHNQFLRIPRVIFSFSQLKVLSLSGNRLTSLKSDLRSLLFLQSLDLSNNHLREYPLFVNSIKGLKVLSLSHNAISVVGNLQLPPNLSVFDLSFNLIEEISFQLPSTASISLDYNRLTRLELALFQGCHFVSVSGNPIEDKLLDKLPELLRTSIRFMECLSDTSAAIPPLPIHILSPSNSSFCERFGIGYSATQGRRQTMEDCVLLRRFGDDFLCGVFDGHGGHVSAVTSAHCLAHEVERRLPSDGNVSMAFAESFTAVNGQLKILNIRDGCTAACVFVRGAHVYCAGIGDSRIVRVQGRSVARMTDDSKPTIKKEFHRLRECDQIIDAEGRLQGKLAVSRSLGDFAFGEGLYVQPDVAKYEIEEDDVGVIIACDGLWDVMSDEAAGHVVRKAKTAADAAVSLRNFAFALGSIDNISVIVLKFDVDPGDRGFAVRNTVELLPVVPDEEDDAPESLPALPQMGGRRKR